METDSHLDVLVRLDWRTLRPIERCSRFRSLIASLNRNFVELLHSETEREGIQRGVLRRTTDFSILVNLGQLADRRFDNHGYHMKHDDALDIFTDFCRRLEIFSVHEDHQNKKVHICFYQEAFFDPRFRDFAQMLIFYSKMAKTHLTICEDQDAMKPLSTREILYLQWAAAGKSDQETSAILNIHQDDVLQDMALLLSKLNANNRVHAVAKATRMNLI